MLVGIPLETGQKQYTVDYKLETYLKIARLYLEDEDPTQGEAYINRAAQLQTQTKNSHLQVIYKVRRETSSSGNWGSSITIHHHFIIKHHSISTICTAHFLCYCSWKI